MSQETDEFWCNELFNDDYWKCKCIGTCTCDCITPSIEVDDSFCRCIVGPLHWDEHAGCSRCLKCGLPIWCPWS